MHLRSGSPARSCGIRRTWRAGRRRRIFVGHFVKRKFSHPRESTGRLFTGKLSGAKESALHAVVEPLREPEKALVWFCRVTPQRKQGETKERPSRDGHARLPPV